MQRRHSIESFVIVRVRLCVYVSTFPYYNFFFKSSVFAETQVTTIYTWVLHLN